MVSENVVKKSKIVCTFPSIYYHIFQLFWLDIKKWAGTHLTVWTSLEFCSSSWKSIRLSKANLVIVSGIFSFAVAGVIHEYGLKWCKDNRLVFHKIEKDIHWLKYFRRILLVSKTFPGFPALGVQNCLKLAI